MLDLDTIPEMFVCTRDRKPQLGYASPRFNISLRDEPHADAEAWLAASEEEREAMRPLFAAKLTALVMRRGQDQREAAARSVRHRYAYMTQWRLRNPEKAKKIAEKIYARRAVDPVYQAKMKLWRKAYYEANKEQEKARRRAWQRANKEAVNAQNALKRARRAALKKAA